jgi:hypothetical protein
MERLTFSSLFDTSDLNIDLIGAIPLMEIIITLFITLLLSFFVFIIYRITYKGVIYSYNFNLSILLMALITSMIIKTISANFVLSLGMVGALSIVRFRSAIKDPMDIVFLFWGIGIGITTGAGFIMTSAAGTLLIGIIILVFYYLSGKRENYILVLKYKQKAGIEIEEALQGVKRKLKSKVMGESSIEPVPMSHPVHKNRRKINV